MKLRKHAISTTKQSHNSQMHHTLNLFAQSFSSNTGISTTSGFNHTPHPCAVRGELHHVNASTYDVRPATLHGRRGRLGVAVLHLAGAGLRGERLGRVVGRVQADEEVVHEQRRRPYPEPHERLGVDGAQQEDVDGDGRRRQPRHQRHPPQLRRPRLRHERPQARRRRQPRRHRHRVRHPPAPVQAPVRGRRHRRRQDGGDARRELVPVGRGGLPRDVVAADEERHGDEHEDEERGDGEEVGEDVEVGEEGDDGGGDEHHDGGVHRRARPGVHLGQPRRHHVRAGDVGEVARLADGADEQHGGHPLERAEGDDVLGPVHAAVGEGD
uniref:Uncharacterized protein n=1 Tax=Oryza brachyantha TaxID=4533 RepID=J3LR28_ORYBR